MSLRLYHYWRSSCSWRVRWALAYKGISCEYVAVNLLTDEAEDPEYRKKNPFSTVPTLEIVDEKRFLTESMAIVSWLDDGFSNTPRLLSQDPWKRAKIWQLAEIVNAGIQPLQNLRVQKRVSDDPAVRSEWSQHWIALGFTAYENLVAETQGRFSVGDELSLADLCLIPQLYNARRNEMDLQSFPRILEIESNCLAEQSCKISSPDQFKI